MGPIPGPDFGKLFGCVAAAFVLLVAMLVVVSVLWLCGVQPGWWTLHVCGGGLLTVLAGVGFFSMLRYFGGD